MSSMRRVRTASAEASTHASRSGPRNRSAISVVSKPSSSARRTTSQAKSNVPSLLPTLSDLSAAVAHSMPGSGRIVCGSGVQIPNCIARVVLEAGATRRLNCRQAIAHAYKTGWPRVIVLAKVQAQPAVNPRLVEIPMHGSPLQSRRLRLVSGAAALLLSAALLASVAQAQTRIVAGMVAHGPPQWPQYIASEFGWLRQDNIELDLIAVGAGGAQQLAGGSLHIA